MKSKSTAALLAFFLGGLGIHRFYLSQTGLGILYLLFSWSLIPFIVSIIDFFVFLFMSEDSFNKIYNIEYLRAEHNIKKQKEESSFNKPNVADEIEKLYNLKEKGIITEEEFQNKKSILIR